MMSSFLQKEKKKFDFCGLSIVVAISYIKKDGWDGTHIYLTYWISHYFWNLI
jgi:hypothetical protein